MFGRRLYGAGVALDKGSFDLSPLFARHKLQNLDVNRRLPGWRLFNPAVRVWLNDFDLKKNLEIETDEFDILLHGSTAWLETNTTYPATVFAYKDITDSPEWHFLRDIDMEKATSAFRSIGIEKAVRLMSFESEIP